MLAVARGSKFYRLMPDNDNTELTQVQPHRARLLFYNFDLCYLLCLVNNNLINSTEIIYYCNLLTRET